ncbi:MAG: RNA polymerase sigma-70 factor [Flavobacteriaceae bacterium]|nr:MAG: RNA polymerase sigma-70 factor [Flavobacteriaceae bacterium]
MFSEEKILIKELKNGNKEAYKYIYSHYYKGLIVYVSKLTHDRSLAEDIVQNTLIKLWVNKERISISSSLKGYLYRSVFNGFASEYAKKKREEKHLIQIKNKIIHQTADLDEEAFEKKIKLLEIAINQLPKKCKNVFLLNKKEGYRYKEIASQLSISEKTVEKHISRAIYRIKQFLSCQK